MNGEPLTESLGVKLTRSENRKLERLSAQTGRSKNGCLRTMIRLFDATDGGALALLRREYLEGVRSNVCF